MVTTTITEERNKNPKRPKALYLNDTEGNADMPWKIDIFTEKTYLWIQSFSKGKVTEKLQEDLMSV